MWKGVPLVAALLVSTGSFAQTVYTPATETPAAGRYNSVILDAIRKMPSGGGYATTSAANAKLASSHGIIGGKLAVQPLAARPSYCSGATYLVLLETVSALQKRGELQISPEELAVLKVSGQPDGVGVWGRWNANGPGTARLFHELGAGRSFVEVDRARPGDFLKIFWKDAVGKNEFGHSVIFLRQEEREGQPGVLFWSSNKPDGYGEKWVPRTKIARMLFTRLERPSALAQAGKLPKKDTYLSQMLVRDSSFAEALKMSGVTP